MKVIKYLGVVAGAFLGAALIVYISWWAGFEFSPNNRGSGFFFGLASVAGFAIGGVFSGAAILDK